MTQAPGERVVVVAVTGSIAAYKACELVRRLRERNLPVRVAMSRSAPRFVAPRTFAALSGARVLHDLFADDRPERLAHVRWAERCGVFVVAPASADFLARMSHGLADDFPSTLYLAVTAPVLVAPAMEDDMARHPSVRENLERLRERGVLTVGPGVGALASGRNGPGRMAEPEEIADAAARLWEGPPASAWLRGKQVVVTCGPTLEAIDPMRVLTNRSSGRMGMAVAAEAALLGARVTVVCGPCPTPAPATAEVVRVDSALEMAEATLQAAAGADVVVAAAAVADFRPARPRAAKISKQGKEALTLELEPTPDILLQLARQRRRPLLVGFAAESDEVLERARAKLQRKRVDLIVANRIGADEGGFGSDDNEVWILDARGTERHVGLRSKRLVAAEIFEAVRAYRRERPA